jgi:hypothetical protein
MPGWSCSRRHLDAELLFQIIGQRRGGRADRGVRVAKDDAHPMQPTFHRSDDRDSVQLSSETIGLVDKLVDLGHCFRKRARPLGDVAAEGFEQSTAGLGQGLCHLKFPKLI